jgi:CheY-like chemotaxis protein
MNLLGNALKYTPSGGQIRVLVKSGEEAVIQVQDNGAGVFDLFARGDFGLQRSPAGLGIGLTLVKRIAELHGGRAEAASEGPGRGSTFTVTLPRIDAAQAKPPELDSKRNESARRRILIIEDNDDARGSLHAFLAESGHEIYEAVDSPTGVEKALEVQPDIVLIDLGLPGVDGYEVAIRIRSMPACSAAILIAVTGYGQSEYRAKAVSAGFNGYLVKPLDATELEKLIA